MSLGFQCTKVLLYGVMQLSQFFTTAVLESWCTTDFPHVSLMDKARAVVPGLQAFDGFAVVLTGT